MHSVDEGVNLDLDLDLDNIYLRPMQQLPSWLRKNICLNKIIKISVTQSFHVAHHLSLLQPYIYAAIFMSPPVAILIMLLPKSVYPVRGQKWFQQIRAAASIGIHSWLWIGLALTLVGWIRLTDGDAVVDLGWTPIIKGLLYLYLSELFLYGFCLHPFM